jgi:type I restriction enzyme S subunit
MGGAAITRLTVKKLCDTKIMIAPLDLQTEFVKVAEQSDKSKFELQKALDELTAMQKKIIEQNLT